MDAQSSARTAGSIHSPTRRTQGRGHRCTCAPPATVCRGALSAAQTRPRVGDGWQTITGKCVNVTADEEGGMVVDDALRMQSAGESRRRGLTGKARNHPRLL